MKATIVIKGYIEEAVDAAKQHGASRVAVVHSPSPKCVQLHRPSLGNGGLKAYWAKMPSTTLECEITFESVSAWFAESPQQEPPFPPGTCLWYRCH